MELGSNNDLLPRRPTAESALLTLRLYPTVAFVAVLCTPADLPPRPSYDPIIRLGRATATPLHRGAHIGHLHAWRSAIHSRDHDHNPSRHPVTPIAKSQEGMVEEIERSKFSCIWSAPEGHALGAMGTPVQGLLPPIEKKGEKRVGQELSNVGGRT